MSERNATRGGASEQSPHCHVCPVWVAYTFDNPLRNLVHHPRRMLGDYVKPGATVLDFGCGLGFFSIAMAKMVGSSGMVIAADLQQKMLDRLERRARRAGVMDWIRLHRTTPDGLGLDGTVSFILACWVVHETPDTGGLFQQFAGVLEPGGHVYVVEPSMHVSKEAFVDAVDSARTVGLEIAARPKAVFSRTVVLRKPIPAVDTGIGGPGVGNRATAVG
ncbi:class I SAM-dependent methyltransferase [bacterium]|nr:class I SAM-dependent methyltransferase [bacterium]